MFQKLMDHVIQGMQDYAVAYLDDLIIVSRWWADHLEQWSVDLQLLDKRKWVTMIVLCDLILENQPSCHI